jgi:hypothetical protein
MRIAYRKIEEGEELPRFYLPVAKLDFGHAVECRFFLIAPFVLIFYILRNASRCIWYDLMTTNNLLTMWKKAKAPENRSTATSPTVGELKGQ